MRIPKKTSSTRLFGLLAILLVVCIAFLYAWQTRDARELAALRQSVAREQNRLLLDSIGWHDFATSRFLSGFRDINEPLDVGRRGEQKWPPGDCFTPLQAAVDRGDEQLVGYFLKLGADRYKSVAFRLPPMEISLERLALVRRGGSQTPSGPLDLAREERVFGLLWDAPVEPGRLFGGGAKALGLVWRGPEDLAQLIVDKVVRDDNIDAILSTLVSWSYEPSDTLKLILDKGVSREVVEAAQVKATNSGKTEIAAILEEYLQNGQGNL